MKTVRPVTPGLERRGGATWNGTGIAWYLIGEVAFNQSYEDTTGCTPQPNFAGLDFEQADNGTPMQLISHHLGPMPGQIERMGSVLID